MQIHEKLVNGHTARTRYYRLIHSFWKWKRRVMSEARHDVCAHNFGTWNGMCATNHWHGHSITVRVWGRPTPTLQRCIMNTVCLTGEANMNIRCGTSMSVRLALNTSKRNLTRNFNEYFNFEISNISHEHIASNERHYKTLPRMVTKRRLHQALFVSEKFIRNPKCDFKIHHIWIWFLPQKLLWNIAVSSTSLSSS